MSAFFDTELCKDLDLGPVEPGKRLFRIEMGDGRALILGAELEVDDGGMSDLRRQVPTDREVCEGVEYASRLMAGNPKFLRGGQD